MLLRNLQGVTFIGTQCSYLNTKDIYRIQMTAGVTMCLSFQCVCFVDDIFEKYYFATECSHTF